MPDHSICQMDVLRMRYLLTYIMQHRKHPYQDLTVDAGYLAFFCRYAYSGPGRAPVHLNQLYEFGISHRREIGSAAVTV